MADIPSAGPLRRRLGAGGAGTALCGLAGSLAWANLRHESLDGWTFWVPVALWLLAMGLLWWWNWRIFWPAVLICAGALLLTRRLQR